MASGDAFQIAQTAGTVNFSFTSAVDWVVTSCTNSGSLISRDTWVDGVSGVYDIFPAHGSTAQNTSNNRSIIFTGMTVTAVTTNVARFGIILAGFEL